MHSLSRASLKDCVPEISDDELQCYIRTITTDLISEEKLKLLQEETVKDHTLHTLYTYIKDGWPTNKKEVPIAIRPYFNFRQELSIFDSIILKGNCIVIPSSMRKDIKNLLHCGHLGIVKTKSLARVSIYWPGMSTDIEDLIQSCSICQEYQNLQRNEPLIHHEIPSKPWVKVGTDLFSLDSNDYLIIVDYNSNYFDISIFAGYGIPKIVISDNGPEFSSSLYLNFSTKWDFKHITSSPHYPKSNGLVERTIQLVKKTLRKAFRNNEDPYLALLSIKVAPGPYNNPSPASLMFKTTDTFNIANFNRYEK